MIPFDVTSFPERILDFDIETVAAGFADPEWVPQKVTCVAWGVIGEGKIQSRIATTAGLYEKPELRRKMLLPLFEEMLVPGTILTGHNVERFDLPVLNAEAMRLGLPPLKNLMVSDTMRLPRAKGFRKGLDNMSELLSVPTPKQAMSWQAWQDAYAELGWAGIRSRCESDVRMHMQLRKRLIENGWLRRPRKWNG